MARVHELYRIKNEDPEGFYKLLESLGIDLSVYDTPEKRANFWPDLVAAEQKWLDEASAFIPPVEEEMPEWLRLAQEEIAQEARVTSGAAPPIPTARMIEEPAEQEFEWLDTKWWNQLDKVVAGLPEPIRGQIQELMSKISPWNLVQLAAGGALIQMGLKLILKEEETTRRSE